MGKKEVTNLEIGNERVIDKNTEIIKFEGTNTDFFWRIYGEVINPKCRLVIPPTHQAIYIKDGRLQDVLESGMYNIFETVKKGFLGIGKKVDATTLDIIFMNRTIKFNAFWGTYNPIPLRDPITEIPVSLRGNGEFEVGIDNPKKFYLEIVGTEKNFNLDSLRERLAVKMMAYIEPVIAKTMKDLCLSYIDIAQHKKEIADSILPTVNEMFVRDCGLKVYSFTIGVLKIADEEMEAIEENLAERRREIKEKLEAKELAAELERLEDKKFDKEVFLRLLEQADRNKYYEVLKIAAANQNNNNNGNNNGAARFCPQCGHSYEPGTRFCPHCGNRLPGDKLVCPECGRELSSDTRFCPDCGHKIER